MDSVLSISILMIFKVRIREDIEKIFTYTCDLIAKEIIEIL